MANLEELKFVAFYAASPYWDSGPVLPEQEDEDEEDEEEEEEEEEETEEQAGKSKQHTSVRYAHRSRTVI